MDHILSERANNQCELCGAVEDLSAFTLAGAEDAEASIWSCTLCREGLEGKTLDEKHWYCLRDCMWSAVPAVQAASYRMLSRLQAFSWAQDLLTQMYLPDEVMQWAKVEQGAVTLDSHGTALSDGDSVTLIKDLDVKGAGFTAKRGTMVKNIRLTDDPTHIEGRVNKTAIYLKTAFLRKA